MKSKFLNKIEEKFLFRISRFFWHIIISLGTLSLVIALLILIWGIIPSFKSSVDKEPYPPVVEVSTREIEDEVNRLTELLESEGLREKSYITEENYIPEHTDSNELVYNQTLDSLKMLFPASKYRWENKGYYYYPYGERYYTRTGGRYGREWRISSYGIQHYLNKAYKEISAESYGVKRALLLSYIPFINKFLEEDRRTALSNLFLVTISDYYTTKKNITELNKSFNVFIYKTTECIKLLAEFRSNNPNEGYRFLTFANQFIINFPDSLRLDILQIAKSNFYKYFNNKINAQIEYSDSFIVLIPKIEAKNLSEFLKVYYKLIVNKNRTRENQINGIENRYASELQKAEYEYLESTVDKAELRLKGIYGVGAGIAFIAVIAIILVLLSIQRYQKMIFLSLNKQQENKKI